MSKLSLRTLGVLSGLIAVSTALFAGCGTTATAPAAKATVQPPAAIAKAGVLKIGSGLAYPPMEYFDSNQKPAGVDVELGQAIGKLMGVKVQWVQIAFAGLIPALNANRIDMIMADMNVTPERAQVVNFVQYLTDGSSIVVAAGNPLNIQTMADLSGKTVAVQLGTTLQALTDTENTQLKAQNKPLISVLTFPQATDAMTQLALGRVSAVLLTTSIAKNYAKTQPSHFSVVAKPVASQPVGIAINKQNPALQKAVTKAVAILKQNGTFQKILNKYFGN